MILFLTILALAIGAPARADSPWEGRLAPASDTEAAIERHRSAIDANPSALEPRWRLLRALHYLSEFTTASEERREDAVNEAVSLAEVAIAAVESSADGRNPTDEAQVYFWSAVAWAVRGQRVGLMTIVREGVARRMYEYASLAVELDPTIERGGALRLLSRLHADLPRVPFVSGWVDRDQALPFAARALAVEPDDPGNQLILALALLESAPERHAESRTLLEAVATAEPRPRLRAEDLAAAEMAAQRLAELDAST